MHHERDSGKPLILLERLDGITNELANLYLIDLQGRILWEENGVGTSTITIAPSLAAGIYFLQVEFGSMSKTLKLVRE